MNEIFIRLNDANSYLTLFLVLVRLAGFFQVLPVFGSSAIPPIVKIMISVVLGVFLLLFLKIPAYNLNNTSWLLFGVLVVKELAIGVFFGLALRIVFFGLLYAMDIVSSMLGLSYASLFDPLEAENSIVLGAIIDVLALLFFLSLNLHHQVIQLMFDSFQWVSPVTLDLQKISYLAVSKFLSQIFLLGLSFAMPLLVSSILVNLSLGFLNRSVPQFNVFLIGSSLVIILGFLILALSLPIFLQTFIEFWNKNFEEAMTILRALGNGAASATP